MRLYLDWKDDCNLRNQLKKPFLLIIQMVRGVFEDDQNSHKCFYTTFRICFKEVFIFQKIRCLSLVEKNQSGSPFFYVICGEPYFYIIKILKQKLISLKIIVKTKYLDISK